MARRRAERPAVALQVPAMGLMLLVVTSCAVGLLYWLRAPTRTWPGPVQHDVLYLDALANHAGVPLVVFLGVFLLAAVVIGAGARALRFQGVTGAIVTGLGVALWLYLTSAVSVFVVDQVPFAQALDTTTDAPFKVVYVVPAVLAAAGVALLGRRGTRAQVGPQLVVLVVGLLGVVDVLVGMVPPSLSSHGIFSLLFVDGITPSARAVSVILGALLLLTLSGLGRRQRRAAGAAAALGVASILFALIFINGFSVTVTLLGALVALLVRARWQSFAYPGDPGGTRTALVRLVSTALAVLAFGVVGLFINRTAADLSFSFFSAVSATVRYLFGVPRVTRIVLSGDFADWFPWSLRAIAFIGVVRAAIWFAPWRGHFVQDDARRLEAERIVQDWGTDSLAPFTLRADKAHFIFPEGAAPAEQVLIAYRVLRGIALISGDPIGPAEGVGAALAAFREHCRVRGWRLAIVGASERHLATYATLGLRALYHGEEAVLETATFSLAGGAMKSVRQAVHRVARNGYSLRVVAVGDLSGAERAELQAFEAVWLQGQPRKGFVMELDDLFRLDGDSAVFVIGRDPDSVLVGFLEFAVCPASNSLSLSSMPRSEAAPNGLNAFLIAGAVDWARARDFSELSLNFSPFARLFDRAAPLEGPPRLARRALLVAKRLLNLQLDNLLSFNQRFCPRWEARYLVYERRRNLGRVVLAAMAAERYLPFTDYLRGPEWQRHAREGRRQAATARLARR